MREHPDPDQRAPVCPDLPLRTVYTEESARASVARAHRRGEQKVARSCLDHWHVFTWGEYEAPLAADTEREKGS